MTAGARRAGILLGMLGLFVILLVRGFSVARAAEGLEEQAHAGRWLFTPGRVEVGGYVGGGLTVQGDPRNATLFVLMPRIGYVLGQQERFLPGSIELLFEPAYYAVFQSKTASVFSASVFFKYNFATRTKLTPFVEAGAGISYATRAVPEIDGSHFNFVVQPGLGIQYAVGERNTLTLSWRFNHLSNGNIYPPNPSLNSSLFLIGFSHLF